MLAQGTVDRRRARQERAVGGTGARESRQTETTEEIDE